MKINLTIQHILMMATTMLMLIILPAQPAMAFNEGPYNPGVGSNVPAIGTVAWQNPGEIVNPGLPYATATLTQGSLYSNYLQGTDYGFNIPDAAPIMGIEVQVNHRVDDHNAGIMDNEVRLVKEGAIVGENRAIPEPWPVAFTLATYGGPSDLWGTAWTPAEINSPDFGVALAAFRSNNGSNLRQAVVDSMQVTVYYGYTAEIELSCGDGTPVAYGDSLLCVVTLSNVGSDQTPSGPVDWSTDGSGLFEPNPCTLEGTDGVASCQVSYTPTAVGSGSHLLTAAYAGDDSFTPAEASQSVEVITRPITVTADEQSKVYGDPDPELTYQVSEGSLVFSDTFTGTLTRQPGEDTGQYEILQGSLALSVDYDLTYVGAFLTINKADATCLVTGYTLEYDREEHTASGSCFGVHSEVLEGLELSGTTHTEIGSYMDDPWVYTDVTGNYNDKNGMVDDEITLRYVTVTADGQSKLFGQPDPVLTYQLTAGSLLEGDEFSGALTRTDSQWVGSYPIMQGTLSLPDYYLLEFISADFTITGRIYFYPIALKDNGLP
jgi:hypothetical protein